MEKKSSGKKITSAGSFEASEVVRVLGIVRASADKLVRGTGESLDFQKKTIENWVRSKTTLNAPQKWQIVEIFEDIKGLNAQRKVKVKVKCLMRPGLARALELAKLGHIDVVVVVKLNHLTRSIVEYVDISAKLNENHVAVVCLDLGVDTTTPEGQMIFRMQANLAQWQAHRLVVARKDRR